jgi:hypothetical protein
MSTYTTERRPDTALRPESEIELLRRVYEDAGLETEAAQEAACADLASLYASFPWGVE